MRGGGGGGREERGEVVDVLDKVVDELGIINVYNGSNQSIVRSNRPFIPSTYYYLVSEGNGWC